MQYGDDVLQSVKTEETAFSENENRTFTLDEGTYKVFMWNKLLGMVPMTKQHIHITLEVWFNFDRTSFAWSFKTAF